MRSDLRRALVSVALAACHSSDSTSHADGAEVTTRYDGTITVSPHGAPQPSTEAGTVSISATRMYAGGCTFALESDDNAMMSYVGNSTCTGTVTATSTVATATIAGAMLTAHWGELTFDDELTDYDFVGTQAN